MNYSFCPPFAILFALCVLMAGCEMSVESSGSVSVRSASNAADEREASADPSPQLVEHSEIAKIQVELAALQRLLESHNSKLSDEVANLRSELSTIRNIVKVRESVRSKLSEIRRQERLRKIDARTSDVESRLRDIEKHMGILHRKPDAPWVKSDRKE